MSSSNSRQNWRQLLVVQVGGSICLPVLMVGQTLCNLYGGIAALIAIILGNIILFAMAWVTSQAGSQRQKSTAEFAVDLFGENGKRFFAGAMVISMVGWFAIQLRLIGSCLGTSLSMIFIEGAKYESWLTFGSTILLGGMIALVSIRGLYGVTLMAKVVAPLLAFTISYALYLGAPYSSEYNVEMIEYTGISLVISCSIAAVIDLPTFFCNARSNKDAGVAALVLFLIAMPLIEGAGVFLSMGTGNIEFVDSIKELSSNYMWKGWVTAFLILAGWATNNANMYSAAVSLKPLLPTKTQQFRLLLVCLIGTIVAIFPILNRLEFFLNTIGIVLSSMGAVLIGFLLQKYKQTNCKMNLVAWGLGVCSGFFNFIDVMMIKMTSSIVLDAFIIALISQITLNLLFSKKNKTKEVIYETNLS